MHEKLLIITSIQHSIATQEVNQQWTYVALSCLIAACDLSAPYMRPTSFLVQRFDSGTTNVEQT